MSDFSKIIKEIDNKDLIRELKFYKTILEMTNSVSLDQVRLMVEEDIKVYEKRKLNKTAIDTINNIIISDNGTTQETVENALCKLNSSKDEYRSFVESDKDVIAVRKVIEKIENNEDDEYQDIHNKTTEIINLMNSGINFNSISEMEKIDLDIFHRNENVDIDEFFDSLPYDKFTNEEAETLSLQLFSKTYNTPSVIKTKKEAYRNILALSIVANNKKNDN